MAVKLKSNDFDISISEIKYHKSNGLNEHYLTLLLGGDDFNIKLLNTLRRVCSNYIPVYAYVPELINITENTSEAFNNDMMKLDLSVMPVFGIDPGIYELDEKYWYNVDYADPNRDSHEAEKSIEFYLNKHNNSLNYIRVTTNDARITVDAEDVKMYSEKYPILLIELTPNQTFKCHMKAVLGIAENNKYGALWKSCFNAYYGDNDKNEFEFTVYGNNMFSEQELLIRSCKFMVSKLNKMKQMIIDKINRKEIIPEKIMKFIFDNEDHTIGEPLNYELQDHKDIIFSGLSKPDFLIKSIVITATCSKNVESPIQALLDSIDIVEQKFSKMGYLLTNLYTKKEEPVKKVKKQEEEEPIKKSKKVKNQDEEEGVEDEEYSKKSKKSKK
jgi:DNA-directed RNA polymerase subunit L